MNPATPPLLGHVLANPPSLGRQLLHVLLALYLVAAVAFNAHGGLLSGGLAITGLLLVLQGTRLFHALRLRRAR